MLATLKFIDYNVAMTFILIIIIIIISTTACNADGVWSSQCVSTVLLSPLHTTLLPGQIMIGGCCVYNTSGQCWGSGEANESVSGVGVRRTSHRRGSG